MRASFDIRPAVTADLADVQRIAEEAYAVFIGRIGKRPAPMDADFQAHLDRDELYVAVDGRDIGGYLVTYANDGAQFIENVAVLPSRRGAGIGYALCRFAEAEGRRRALPVVRLYTHVKMTENMAYYARLGYTESYRVTEDGFERVYMEKRLIS